MSYVDELLGRQNADGGWNYSRGGSWTEPTFFALFALAALDRSRSDEVSRGFRWLAKCQRADGGLAPRETVTESTWLTALALFITESNSSSGLDLPRAEAWVLKQSGRESGWVNRLRYLLMGETSDTSFAFDGWPWYPGTAAWVGPTALSILALEKFNRGKNDPAVEKRISEGRSFLLTRRCRDGGWNHGSTKALGYDSDSYPESTGIALLALHGDQSPEVARGIAKGEEHLASCQSNEAANWLRLGLMAHGRPAPTPERPVHGTVMEISVAALADSAANGRNLFLPG